MVFKASTMPADSTFEIGKVQNITCSTAHQTYAYIV